MTRSDHPSADDSAPSGEDPSSLSGARLFPIGFGLGAVAALALFFGYRAVAPGVDGAGPSPVTTSSSSRVAEPVAPPASTAEPIPAETPASGQAAIASSVADPSIDAEPIGAAPASDGVSVRLVTTEDPSDTGEYAATTPDISAATPLDAPDLDGLEELASLSDGPRGATRDDGSEQGTALAAERLPSIEDTETSELFGGAVIMVSSSAPQAIVLADGTSLAPGETLPGGHRIVDIHRERILLERDGLEWRVRIP